MSLGQASTDAGTPAPSRVRWWQAARVHHWAHFLLLPLAGMDLSRDLRGQTLGLARGIFISFCVLAFGYLLNGVSDRYMDASVRKNPLVEDTSVTSHSTVLVILVALAALASLFAPWPVAGATAVAITSGIVYSIGPRIKRFPFIGTLANVTNFAPLLWVGLTSLEATSRLKYLTACFSCLLLQNQLLHEAADRDEDKNGGIATTFLVLGPKDSSYVALLLGLALMILGAEVDETTSFFGTIGFVFALFFPTLLWLGGKNPARMKSARLMHRAACLITGALLFYYSGFKY